MTEIELDTLIAAARRAADAVDDDGATTRRRIRQSLDKRSSVRTRRITIIGAVVATMFGSTAFAYYRADGRVPWSTSPAEVPPAPRITEVAQIEAPPIVDVVAVRELAPPPPEAGVVISIDAPVQRVTSAPPSATIDPPSVPDPELAAYRVAHEAHFHGTSPAAALAAWDEFLAQYPHGVMESDARFSRALVLIKLERFVDARAALQPFADAPAGSYRQAEATKLVQALPTR